MAAVMGLSAESVREVCARVSAEAGIVCLANHNSAQQAVISGEVAAVSVAGEALRGAGAKRVVPLQVSGAFHSPLLREAGEEFTAELDRVTLSRPAEPIVANVSARAVREETELRTGLASQLTSPVLWHETMETIIGGGEGDPPRLVLEVGPGRVLTNLAKRAYPEVQFVPVGTAEDLDKVLDTVREHLT
jgi:[acyl-carrier-protein] S-malonyltransferase